jgi:Ser/Thr protein kinase RdoA (MazF antagonist)
MEFTDVKKNISGITSFIHKTYGLVIDSVEFLEMGVLNSNFLVVSGNNKYIFKIYIFKDIDQVKFEVEVLNELSRSGFPCPRLIASKDGQILTKFQNYPVVFYEYMEGNITDSLDGNQLLSVGQMEAKMHELLKDFRPSVKKSTWDFDDLRILVEENYEKMLNSGFPGAKELMDIVKAEIIKYKFPDSLPSGITHQDVKPENIIIRGGRIVGIIDFDNSYLGCLIHDLTTTVIWTCFDKTGIDVERVEKFVTGYESVRKLTDGEKNIFPMAIKFRLLREAFIGPFVTMHRPKISKERSDNFINLYRNFDFHNCSII